MSVRAFSLVLFLLASAAACGRSQQQPNTKITIDAARRTALARVPGQVIEEELEDEDGRWVYEFDIRPTQPGGADQEVVVDANTGQVVKVEAD